MEQLAEQASKALYPLMINLKTMGHVPIHLAFKIFDTKILPILHYGSELWGYIEAPVIEKIHIKFCKFLVSSQSSFIHASLRGDLGRSTLRAVRLIRIIKYWLRLFAFEQYYKHSHRD